MPRLFSMVPIEATAMPLPTELTTPPVTNTYFDIEEYHKPFRLEKTLRLDNRRGTINYVLLVTYIYNPCQVFLTGFLMVYPEYSRLIMS